MSASSGAYGSPGLLHRLADYEIDQLVEGLQQDNGQSVTYPLLSVEITYADTGETDHYLALNESTLKNSGVRWSRTFIFKTNYLNAFGGDGLCVSTPTGSTAYNNRSGCGHPPAVRRLTNGEIASINNRVFRTLGSPVIVAPYETITIKPQQQSHFIFTADQMDTQPRPIQQIRYSIANRRIAFAQHRHNRFGSGSGRRLSVGRRMKFSWINDNAEPVKVRTVLSQHGVTRSLLKKVKFHGGAILVNGQPV